MKLEKVKLYVFDLDGTVYRDGELIGNAGKTLRSLRESGCKIAYLTNNSSCARECYEEKLKKIGIYERGDVVYSSLDCAVDFLRRERAGKTVYAVATEMVREYLSSKGISIMTDKDARKADILLLTFDQELTYSKIAIANELLVTGKEYIATHPDLVCPTQGISVPDIGSFIALLQVSSGRTPDVVLGKPHAYMAKFLVDSFGLRRSEVAMVGDRLYTDIQFGINAGLRTVLVLSGETTYSAYISSGIKADCVLKSIDELVR